MENDTFLFGWGLGLLYVSLMAIFNFVFIELGVGSFIGIGIIGIICLIVNFSKGGKDEHGN